MRINYCALQCSENLELMLKEFVKSVRYLEPNTTGTIPPGGYRMKMKQSYVGYEWLMYLMVRDSALHIRHGRNDVNGEFRVDNFLVDVLTKNMCTNSMVVFGTGVFRVIPTVEMWNSLTATEERFSKFMKERSLDARIWN